MKRKDLNDMTREEMILHIIALEHSLYPKTDTSDAKQQTTNRTRNASDYYVYHCTENDIVVRIYPTKHELWVGADDGEWSIIGYGDFFGLINMVADLT